ncbi:LysR family transcriptional regulator [Vreelandella subglaciescola]|uniref:Transcriptional regulator, LysR family n=1 Tax=Vreelandella subglaciescola TaxID=29571 RepID=A0A1M7GU70_9GAMM|nr:LysR family transcriptional regulator [Halomonas subglaciescola]SHM19658.1 transcriptional regulator, LysR family [Halomonas subglaciescola]
MTVKQIRAFLAVAQTLSFVQACERLHLSQPALSLAIKSLEENLGGQLFNRTTRSVRLTPEGEALLPLARRLITDWDNAQEELQQRFCLDLGRVTVAAIPSFSGNLLPAILKTFRTNHPGISIKIQDVINEQVIEMVQVGDVELGLAFEPHAVSGLHFTPLYTDRFVAVVPGNSPLAQAHHVRWEHLLEEPFIALQRPSAVRYMLEDALVALNRTLPVELESHQLTTVARMVASGLGVSVVPALCVSQMEALGARCLPLHDPTVERPFGVLQQPGHELSVAARALFDTLLATQWRSQIPDATHL